VRRIEPLAGDNSSLGLSRRLIALAIAAALVAIAPGCKPSSPPAAATQQASASGPGGPFTLVDDNGHAVDQSILKGKWSVVFFGYTFCPDVCPTTLTALGQAMKQLGAKADKAQVVFITVDPARDTPTQLKTYLSSPVFPKNTVGLTGTPDQIARAAKAYYVYYQKDGAGADYSVDHSTAMYLMNPDGEFVKPIADGLPPAEIAHQISEVMGGA
jgi:protein SCO1/2